MADEKDIYAAIEEARKAGQSQQAEGGQTPPAPAAAAPPATPSTPEPFDENKWLTEKFGGKFKTFDELQAEINKPAQIQYKAPEFPDEDSKTVYENLIAGKTLDILPVLEKKKFATQLPNLTDDEKILAHIGVEYPSLSEQQRKRELERRYKFDESGLDTDDIELERTKINDRKKRDAQNATEYFTKHTSELKFPKVEQPSAVQQLSDQQKQFFEMGVTYGSEDKISKFPFEFDAKEKNIAVKGEFTLPADRISKIEEQIAADPQSILAGFVSRYYTPDDKVNVKALARDILYLTDPASWANQVAKEALEQTYTERLKQEKNYRDSNQTGKSAFSTPEESERDAMYKAFGVPKANGVTVPQG